MYCSNYSRKLSTIQPGYKFISLISTSHTGELACQWAHPSCTPLDFTRGKRNAVNPSAFPLDREKHQPSLHFFSPEWSRVKRHSDEPSIQSQTSTLVHVFYHPIRYLHNAHVNILQGKLSLGKSRSFSILRCRANTLETSHPLSLRLLISRKRM